jgi:hypothetical protein
MPNTDEQNAEYWREIRDNMTMLIGSITANPKPNYDIDGQRVDWADYLDMLLRRKALAEQTIIDLEGPFEVTSQAYL